MNAALAKLHDALEAADAAANELQNLAACADDHNLASQAITAQLYVHYAVVALPDPRPAVEVTL